MLWDSPKVDFPYGKKSIKNLSHYPARVNERDMKEELAKRGFESYIFYFIFSIGLKELHPLASVECLSQLSIWMEESRNPRKTIRAESHWRSFGQMNLEDVPPSVSNDPVSKLTPWKCQHKRWSYPDALHWLSCLRLHQVYSLVPCGRQDLKETVKVLRFPYIIQWCQFPAIYIALIAY